MESPMISSSLNSPLMSASNDPKDRASRVEMAFAGHYLNLGGLLLLLSGLVSYLKSSGASNGAVESGLGAALGLVLLLAGELLYRKGLEQYSHPLLTGGFCLLFFSACASHFLFNLVGQGTLFGLLTMVVVCSNASVFRYNSKLIGNVMLVVYFFTPLFITFEFESFPTILAYLLAINLGTTLVALFKKWDFQLLVASLGSYALYFAHFPAESPGRSLLLLFLVYTISLVGSVSAHFLRTTPSDTNIVLSFVSPSVFAIFSSVQMLRLPNAIPFTAYLLLAVVHGWVAIAADRRRGEHDNFPLLATTHLTLGLLFLSAGISFVTYFSTTTTYFGLVTLLWFGLSLALLWSSFRVKRHSLVLSRYSVLALTLATAQLAFVLPSMLGSEPLQILGTCLVTVYLSVLASKREQLSIEMRKVMSATLLVDILLVARLLWKAYLPYPALCLLFVNSLGALLHRRALPIPGLVLQGLVVAAALFLPVGVLHSPLSVAALMALLATTVLAYRWAKAAEQTPEYLSLVSGLGCVLLIRLSLMAEIGPLTTLSWALLAAGMLHRHVRHSPALDWNLMGQGAFDSVRLLFLGSFLKSVVVDANLIIPRPWHATASFLTVVIFLYCAHVYCQRVEVRNLFVLSGLLMMGFQLTYHLHTAWGHLLIFQPILSGFWSFLGFAIISVGVMTRVKIYRLFGLTTLVASVLKILVVDIHLLDSYSQTNTYLILGTLLMTTSLLYQKQRARLCGEPEPPRTTPALA